MKQDIVDRLRDRSFSMKARDPLCEEAAAEIERLREQSKLDGESLGQSIAEYNEMKSLCANGGYLTELEKEALIVASIELNALHCSEEHHSYTLRKLLERLGTRGRRG